MKLHGLRYLANLLFVPVGLLVGLLSVFACLDGCSHEAYLLTCFRFQYLVVQLACFLGLIVLRNWLPLCLCLILTLPNIYAVSPYFMQPVIAAHSAGQEKLRICQINVNCANRQTERVIAYIKSSQPDVILLEELTEQWDKVISSKLPEYTSVAKVTRWDAFGIGIYSRIPFDNFEIKQYGNLKFPAIVTSIHWAERKVRVINVHTLPVLYSPNFKLHLMQIKEIADDAASSVCPTIVAGDFNSPWWSLPMQQLKIRSGLRTAAEGFGWLPTWPKELQQWGSALCVSNPLFMIPIDHCLVSKELAVTKFSVGDSVGSDHCPLLIECRLAGP